MRSVIPIFETATDTMTDFPNVDLVLSRRLGAMFRFFVRTGVYKRSFCALEGSWTVKIFSSLNQIISTACSEYCFSSCLQRVKRARRFASDNNCARRRFTHFNPRSRWMILATDDRCMPVFRQIIRTASCVLGLSSWLRTRSSTSFTFSVVRVDRGLPLPFCRLVVPVKRTGSYSTTFWRLHASILCLEIHSTVSEDHNLLKDFNQHSLLD